MIYDYQDYIVYIGHIDRQLCTSETAFLVFGAPEDIRRLIFNRMLQDRKQYAKNVFCHGASDEEDITIADTNEISGLDVYEDMAIKYYAHPFAKLEYVSAPRR